METLLFFLGVIGFGALIIAVHVFSVDPNTFNQVDQPRIGDAVQRPGLRERAASDRRSGQIVEFPLVVNGVLIREDRRVRSDRRQISMMRN